MSSCLCFAGQGTQFVGMSKGLNLDASLDSGLLALMDQGPAEELDLTINAQVAVLAVELALLEGCPEPAVVMGHSLGEYAALVAAGVLDAADALALVGLRARAMRAAGELNPGTMGAVIGLETAKVLEVAAGLDGVWVANLNAPGQIVLAGTMEGLAAATPVFKEAGARRVLPLKVSVASHCPLMQPAAEQLAMDLERFEFRSPRIPLVMNATAAVVADPLEIKRQLVAQLVSPVRWIESIEGVSVDTFVEVGPKSVLASLIRRIRKDAALEMRTAA